MMWVLKEPSQRCGSFEHPKHLFKPMGKKIFIIVRSKIVFILTCVCFYFAAASKTFLSPMKEEYQPAVDFRNSVDRSHILGATGKRKCY